MSKIIAFVSAVLFSFAVQAEEKIIEITGGQVSVPVGLTVLVKSVTIGNGATKVHLQASFDGDTSFINMNDDEKAHLSWGEADHQRLHLRAIADNKWMRIHNGTTMEGELIYPGLIPDEVDKIELVFNAGRSGNDSSAPGIVLPLDLKK